MKVTTERLPDCQVALTIEPDEKAVQAALRKAARQISRHYSVPGFRKGKAPYHAVVRAYGKEVLYEQVIEDLGDSLYRQALDESDIDAVAPGELQDVTFDPLVFHMVVPVAPVVDLGDYRSVRVDRPTVEVDEEEVQKRLESLQASYSEWVPVEEGGAQFGDLVTLNLKGVTGEDDIIIEEEDFELVLEQGGEDFPPGFDAQFVGKQAGDQAQFELEYPESWPSERAGVTAQFEAEVLDVKRFEALALDDDFAPLVGEFDTLEELTDSVRDDIRRQAQDEADNEYANQVLEAILENATSVEYPAVLVDQRVEYMLDEQKRNLQRLGLPFSEFLRLTGQSEEQFRGTLRANAETQVRGDLVLEELALQERISPSEEEVEEQVQSLLDGSGEDREAVEEMLASPSGRQAVAFDLTRRQTIERLMQIGDGTAPALEAEGEEDGSTDAEVDDTTAGVEEAGASEVSEEDDPGADVQAPADS